MTHRFFKLAGAVAVAAGLAACASSDPYGPNNYPVSSINPNPGGVTYAPGTYNAYPGNNAYPGTAYVAPQGVEWGRVTNVQMVSSGTRASGNSAAGTVIGGVVGGALGNQVGHVGGRAAATILGAVAGAAIGNSVASNNSANNYGNYAGPVYRVWVQTDAGAMRTFDVGSSGELRPGDRVRIEGGVIYLG